MKRIQMKRIVFTLSMLGFLAIASASQAVTSLLLDDCDAMGCEGSTLFLSVADTGGGTWQATYTINTDGYTGSLDGFNQIGFKAVSGWTSATLTSAPNGTGNWSSVIEGPINSNSQCSNGGTTDKLCIYGQNSLLNISGGGDYTWVFNIVGGSLLPTDDWHLGAQYADALGPARGHIISAEGGGDGPPIPEPSAALLFGVGALVVTRRVRGR
jgi:hypothetical protein